MNKEKLNEILFLLDDVTDIRCTAEGCDKVKLNPLFDDHTHILELCKLYLSNQVIDMDSEDSRNFCFLVPMEYIFEDFIFGFISNKWPALSIKGQSTDFLALNQGVPVFQIKNDININNELIIDTKYKIRERRDGLKAGVNQNDLYQMVSYGIRRNCKNILLLYPRAGNATNAPAMFHVPSAMLKEQIDIEVRSIDISFDDIQVAEALIEERIRQLNPIFSKKAY
jgi:5-methylcytosine-specific restriction enzyme subunit McrC